MPALVLATPSTQTVTWLQQAPQNECVLLFCNAHTLQCCANANNFCDLATGRSDLCSSTLTKLCVYQCSSICGRFITAATASDGVRALSQTCATAVSTGSDSRYLRASDTTTPAVATPSATWVLDARISSSFSPLPSRMPTALQGGRESRELPQVQ